MPHLGGRTETRMSFIKKRFRIIIDFFKKYSYIIVKLFVNQLAISIFGAVLSIACGMAENTTLKLITSVFAVLFYAFLNYSVLWDVGYKELPSIEAGRQPRRPLNGLYIAMFAAIPSLLLAFFFMLGKLFGDVEFLTTIAAICGYIAAYLVEGMYTGMLACIKVAGSPAISYWISYYIIIIPGLIVGMLGYYFGIRNIHLTRILIADTPEDLEKKRESRDKSSNN